MQPVNISPTIQEYDGERFYLCGVYFQHKGRRLHRVIWEKHNGPVPQGYHVHHKDGNKHNNALSNLCLMEGAKHTRQHMTEDDVRERSRRDLAAHARPAAAEWHGSEAGLAWHSKLGKANWEKRSVQTYTCDFCGEEYQTKYVYSAKSRHFCSDNCKMKARRRRLNAGIVG